LYEAGSADQVGKTTGGQPITTGGGIFMLGFGIFFQKVKKTPENSFQFSR
jgi:hypothetical protein